MEDCIIAFASDGNSNSKVFVVLLFDPNSAAKLLSLIGVVSEAARDEDGEPEAGVRKLKSNAWRVEAPSSVPNFTTDSVTSVVSLNGALESSDMESPSCSWLLDAGSFVGVLGGDGICVLSCLFCV